MDGRKFVASPKTRLPPEVWQKVFLRVNDDEWLGNAEILEEKFKRLQLMRDITLTCRSFRWLAQPLLFQSPRVYPFTRTAGFTSAPPRMALRDDIAEDAIERLAFLASDRIAPYVRNISVSLARYRGGPPVEDENVVLRALIHHLRCFIGLQKLIFAQHLALSDGDFIPLPSGFTPTLPLTHYVGPRVLLPLLSNEPTLRSLRLMSLDSGFDDTALVMDAITSRDITSQMTELVVCIDYLTEEVLQTIVSLSPRLTNLQLTVRNDIFAEVPGLLVSFPEPSSLRTIAELYST